MRTFYCYALLIALFGALLAVPGKAEEQAPFGETISVTEVQLAVRVLRQGEPVRGLTREDFVVSSDGESLEITGFSVIDLATSGAEPAATEAGADAIPPPRRNLLFLFDFEFGERSFLVRAVRGAQELVAAELPPGDRIAVALYNGAAGFHLITGFTADRARAALALDVVYAQLDKDQATIDQGLDTLAATGGGLQTLSDAYGPAAAIAIAGSPALATSFEFGDTGLITSRGRRDGRSAAEIRSGDPTVARLIPLNASRVGSRLAGGTLLSRIRSLAISLTELVTLLRDVEGQNHLLYFSEGFPTRMLRDHAVTRYLEGMHEAFRRSSWTLQAIDIEGVPLPDRPGFDADSLFYMANETGGELFENDNDIGRAAARVQGRTQLTYLLTFRPQEQANDGRYHRVKVALRNASFGTRLLYRAGYYAPKPQRRRSGLEAQLDTVNLLLGTEERQGLHAAVLAAPLADAATGRLPVVVEVEGASLAPGPPETGITLEVQVCALDPQGGVHDIVQQRLELEPRWVETHRAAGGLRLQVPLTLAPGPYRLRVLVRNPKSGQTYLATQPLTVAPTDGDEALLFPPLFMPPANPHWLVARPAEGDAAYGPFTLAERPFVPVAEPVITSGGTAPVCLLGRNLVDGPLRSRLLDDAGQAVVDNPLPTLRRVPDAGDGLQRLVGHLQTPALPPGNYRLEISFTDPTGLWRIASSTGLRIVP